VYLGWAEATGICCLSHYVWCYSYHSWNPQKVNSSSQPSTKQHSLASETKLAIGCRAEGKWAGGGREDSMLVGKEPLLFLSDPSTSALAVQPCWSQKASLYPLQAWRGFYF